MAKVEDKFIVKLQGKDFILYNGLVDMAHEEGLVSMDVELIQLPDESNNMTAIAKATATTKDRSFTDVGDASPRSVSGMLKPHIIRMASTRAKARALRDLTNVGMTAVEEMGGEDSQSSTPKKNNSASKTNVKGQGGISEAQVKRLYAIAYSANIDRKIVDSQVKSTFNKSVKDLTRKEYDRVVKGYESKKEEK